MAKNLQSRPSAPMSGARAPLTRRFAWGVAVVGLGLALALGGCGARTAHQNTGASTTGQQTQTTGGSTAGGSTSVSTPTTNATSSNAVQAVQNLDQQTQNDTSTLNNAQNDANTDYSSQDTPTQP